MSTRAFLAALFHDCDPAHGEVRFKQSGQRLWTDCHDWSSVGRAVSAAVSAGEDVYFSLATRRTATTGDTENLRQLPAFFGDLDYPVEQARRLLETFPFRYTFLVNSGLNAQAYFLIKEPLALESPAEIHRAASLQRRLAAYLGADDRCVSPAVTPRLPGTRNYKYGSPRPVTLVDQTDAVVNACELEDFLPAEVVRANSMTIRSSIPADASNIPLHTRNDTLYALTRSLRCAGMPFSAIVVAIDAINEKICDPPLDAREVKQLLHHALAQPNRLGFEVPAPRSIVHDAELQPAIVPTQTAAAFVAALVATMPADGLPGQDVRQRAAAARISERTLQAALRRAGLQPVYTGRGADRRVQWQIDTAHEENR